MSAFRGPNEERVKIVAELSVDDFNKNIKNTFREIQRDSITLSSRIRSALSFAADIKNVTEGIVNITRSAFNSIQNSVERMRQNFGENDPIVRSFDNLRASATSLIDTFVRSLLTSQRAQQLVIYLTELFENLSETLLENREDIHIWVNYFVDQGLGLIRNLTVVYLEIQRFWTATGIFIDGTIEFIKLTFDKLKMFFYDFVGWINSYARSLNIPDIIPADELERRITSLRQEMIEKFKIPPDQFDEFGLNEILTNVSARLNEVSSDIDNTIEGMDKRFQELSQTPVPTTQQTKDQEGFARTRTKYEPLLESFRDIATGTTSIFENAVRGISNLFDMLGKKQETLFNDFLNIDEKYFVPISDALRGVAVLGSTVEQSFGKSSKAAKVFGDVQLGLLGITSFVEGLFQIGKYQEQLTSSGDPMSAALHLGSALSFFAASAASGVALGKSVGAFGKGGNRGGRGSSSSQNLINETKLENKTEIKIYIEGNIVDNRDYVRNSLLPTIRSIVEGEDKVLTSSQVISI